jgi:hypothetical protein|tara:strand:- start:2859 stop:3407 length:549 start_codon:yes stop_codon:yes gene_type:complete
MIKYKAIDREIAYTKLPKEIIKELSFWKKECDKIKKHPLSKLKLHENAGSKTNSYQVSVPSTLIENSYWIAFVLRLCALITKEDHTNFFIRKCDGHFNGYDVWINYSYKGNSNPVHNHLGFISGVIYLNNKNDATYFVDKNITFVGKKGDMILFPSFLKHKVEKQKKEYERITFAFNVDKNK